MSIKRIDGEYVDFRVCDACKKEESNIEVSWLERIGEAHICDKCALQLKNILLNMIEE